MAEKDGKVRALILTALLICSAFGATVMFTGVASADTLVVNKTNSSAYNSIQNAVDNASDGCLLTCDFLLCGPKSPVLLTHHMVQ